jgi:CO/xanthine dehydrogenase Mo-binding subunit
MATTETKTTYIGASVERKEDARLLRGETRWVDNMTLPGMLWMAVVRSPYAHAKIKNVDLSQALSAKGVVAAFSAASLASARLSATTSTRRTAHTPGRCRTARSIDSSPRRRPP